MRSIFGVASVVRELGLSITTLSNEIIGTTLIVFSTTQCGELICELIVDESLLLTSEIGRWSFFYVFLFSIFLSWIVVAFSPLKFMWIEPKYVALKLLCFFGLLVCKDFLLLAPFGREKRERSWTSSTLYFTFINSSPSQHTSSSQSETLGAFSRFYWNEKIVVCACLSISSASLSLSHRFVSHVKFCITFTACD